jgi:hypothetical protein
MIKKRALEEEEEEEVVFESSVREHVWAQTLARAVESREISTALAQTLADQVTARLLPTTTTTTAAAAPQYDTHNTLFRAQDIPFYKPRANTDIAIDKDKHITLLKHDTNHTITSFPHTNIAHIFAAPVLADRAYYFIICLNTHTTILNNKSNTEQLAFKVKFNKDTFIQSFTQGFANLTLNVQKLFSFFIGHLKCQGEIFSEQNAKKR